MSSGMTRRRGARAWFARAAHAATLCLVAATWAAAQSPKAAPHCTPVGGSVMTNFIAPDTTLGTATGDLAGAVSATVPPDQIRPGPDGTIILTVQHHWVTEAGDLIFMKEAYAQGQPLALAPGLVAIVDYKVDIIGGTGKFAGATGTTTNIGEVDMIGGRTVLRYQGSVCFPAPGR